MAIEDNSGPQRHLKITLSVLYSLGIAISLIFLAQAIIGLLEVSTIDDDNSKSTPRTTFISFGTTDKDPKNEEADQSYFIAGIVVMTMMLLYCSIALFAIVKEKKYILMIFTAFQVVVCGLFLWNGYLFTAIGHGVMATMLGLFTEIAFKRQKLR